MRRPVATSGRVALAGHPRWGDPSNCRASVWSSLGLVMGLQRPAALSRPPGSAGWPPAPAAATPAPGSAPAAAPARRPRQAGPVTVKGPHMYKETKRSTVTVNQASDLVNQLVHISWTAFTPSGAVIYARTPPTPVMVAECAGTTPTTAERLLRGPARAPARTARSRADL